VPVEKFRFPTAHYRRSGRSNPRKARALSAKPWTNQIARCRLKYHRISEKFHQDTPQAPPPTCPTLARAAPPHAAGTTRRVRCWAAMEGEGVCVWPRRLATCICMPTARSRRQGKNFESGSAYSSRGGGGTACAGGGAGRSPERCVWCARVAGCGTTTPQHTAHSAQRTATARRGAQLRRVRGRSAAARGRARGGVTWLLLLLPLLIFSSWARMVYDSLFFFPTDGGPVGRHGKKNGKKNSQRSNNVCSLFGENKTPSCVPDCLQSANVYSLRPKINAILRFEIRPTKIATLTS
jgi:hypothetical protein